MVVTDVFWMDDDQVGVADVLKDGTPVRLRVGDFGADGAWLDADGGSPVMAFSTLRLHLGDAPPDISPPFTEDCQAAATGHRSLRMLELTDIAGFLEGTCSASARDIFGAQIHVNPGGGKDWYVADGEGERSLGTVKPAEVHSVTVRRNRDEGFMDFRLSFRDTRARATNSPSGMSWRKACSPCWEMPATRRTKPGGWCGVACVRKSRCTYGSRCRSRPRHTLTVAICRWLA